MADQRRFPLAMQLRALRDCSLDEFVPLQITLPPQASLFLCTPLCPTQIETIDTTLQYQVKTGVSHSVWKNLRFGGVAQTVLRLTNNWLSVATQQRPSLSHSHGGLRDTAVFDGHTSAIGREKRIPHAV